MPQQGSTQNLGGVFGARASPYLGALLQGIFGGANFQQAQQTPRYLTGSFNPQAYMQQNPDVAAAVQRGDMPSAMYHYMNYGMNEGRAPNATATGSGPGYLGSALMGKFNPTNYLAANPDVAAAIRAGQFSSPYAHFQQYGLREGRSPSGFGPTTGMAPQWMAPRQTPPGMSPQSAAIPAIQQAQPSQMPYLPQPMPAGTAMTGAGAGTATAPGTTSASALPADLQAFYSKYFPSAAADGGWVEGSG
jgi:hypothetical protein